MLNFEKFESPVVLKAEREGVANCYTYLIFRENSSFTEESVCFGISTIKGNYTVKSDSVFMNFNNGDKKTAVLQPNETLAYFISDTLKNPMIMKITLNTLTSDHSVQK